MLRAYCQKLDMSSWLCSGSYPHTLCFKVYLVFVFDENLEKYCFGKIVFIMSQIFPSYKNSQIFNNMPWFCASMFLSHKTIFVEFLSIYGIFIKPKRPIFKPKISGSGSSDFSELTVAGRPGRSTGRAQRARLCALEDGRPDRSTASESFALGNYRSTGPVDRQRVLLSPPVARSTGSVDRRLQRSDFDRCRSTGSSDRAQRSDFSGLYKRGFCHCFEPRF